METKLVIFDYDGVLVDSLPAVREVYEIIAKEFNIKNHKDCLQNWQSFFELDYKKTLKKWNITTAEDISKVNLIFRKEMSLREMNVMPFREISLVLKTLKENYTLGIASNNFRKVLVPALKKNGLIDYFDFIVGAEDGKLKPDPDLLYQIIKKAGVKKEEAVFVGDMDGDIEAGKMAGIKKTIAVLYGWHAKYQLSGADTFISSPLELIGAVR
ncbi:MAG: HAD-IA family hydrolase [archaeon]